MPLRRSPVALLLAAALAAGAPGGAAAQDSSTLPDGTQLPGLPQATTGSAGGATLGTTPPAAADPAATTPTEPGIAATTPTGAPPAAADASATTPGPPPYLVPGPDAQQQPISAVAALTDATVPAEPLRIGALVAALLAILLLAVTALLRALGLRTPVVDPVAAAPEGRVGRLGDRLRGTADDMRDFLRRSR